jgi:pSer/pThr/pTyr-binding forkhead associated (FHA) protein
VFCNNCGHQNPAGANFCSSCGHALDRPAEDATITFHALDLGEQEVEQDISVQLSELGDHDAMLLVTRGTNNGATYLLDTDVVRVGRHPENDIFLDDVTVSRRHAEFRREGEGFVVQDVGSLNGSYLNGERVEHAKLVHGDEVQVGKFKLIYLTGRTEHP